MIFKGCDDVFSSKKSFWNLPTYLLTSLSLSVLPVSIKLYIFLILPVNTLLVCLPYLSDVGRQGMFVFLAIVEAPAPSIVSGPNSSYAGCYWQKKK